ncbi:MAG TPA: CotH kinase family protein [Armatimonadota bacterium]
MKGRWLISVWAISAIGLWGLGARAQDVVISEFMASNDQSIKDEDGFSADWLELYNMGTEPANLDGWYLTDNVTLKTKWRIPAITLDPGQFKIIFCSKKDRVDPAGPLHTNFKLGASGQYLGLIRPDGVTAACEYAPTFPPQQTDVSYGMAFTGVTHKLISAGAPAKAIVPTNGNYGTAWVTENFNDASWRSGTTGIGYERSTGYESLIGLDVGAAMYNAAGTAYIRIPFTADGSETTGRLTLSMKYDDGFVAYLNGTRVASASAPDLLAFDSTATANHDDSLALQYEDFDISSFAGKIHAGTNVLAIQGMNVTLGSSDFLIMPELTSSTGGSITPTSLRYFTVPTPGAPNGTSASDQGPVIVDVGHSPLQPSAGEAVTISARVTPSASALGAVTLNYRINYGAIAQTAMLDDGLHGDGDAGDGVFGAVIPGTAFAAGQMIRYYVTAMDAGSRISRYPYFANQTDSPEYLGTVAASPTVTSLLPIFYWFVEDPDAAGTDTGTYCSIYFGGRFYDHVHVRLRGQTSASWPKKHYKFDMNHGFDFVYDPAQAAVTEFNVQSTFSDKSNIRSILAWETYANAGAPGCITWPIRVQQNGAFHSVATFLEQPNGTMLTRNGLDADGALYKMYNEGTDAVNNVEKKTRQTEDNSDLQAFVNGIQLTGPALTNYLFDNVNLPEAINYVAATSIMHDNDHAGKNYYLYRDTDGSGEWSYLPWDKDLTFGRNFVPWDGGVLSDTIWADVDPYGHPFFGDSSHPKVDGPWNRPIDALFREPTVRSMYLRRLRTLMDDLLQAPGTAASSLKFEARISALQTQMSTDAALDRLAWGNPYGASQPMATAIAILKGSYLTPRRKHLFVTHSTGGDGLIPPSQAATPDIRFGASNAVPASGNQEEEYLQIVNAGESAADISGWTLSGDISHTFAPGTVIAAHGSLYVSPDVSAFRRRATSPRGGEGRFVQGNYHGHLSSAAASVELRTDAGTLVADAKPTADDVARALRIAGGVDASADGFGHYDSDLSGQVELMDAVRAVRRVAGFDL